MRKHAIVLGVAFLGLAAFSVFAGWAFYQGSKIDGGWPSFGPIWLYFLGGCLVVAVLTAFLMWLAFYSASHGYDDRVDHEGP